MTLNNGTVNVQKEDAKNTLTSLKNVAKVDLFDESGQNLNQIHLPVYNQITVLDSALTPAYAQIKLTKLRKELKMTHLEKTVLKESVWITQNLENDLVFVGLLDSETDANYTNVRLSQATSTVKSSLNFLIFNLAKIQANHLERISDLYANAFYFASL